MTDSRSDKPSPQVKFLQLVDAGDIASVRTELKNNNDLITALNEKKQNALHVAVLSSIMSVQKTIDMIKLLISFGADINSFDRKGNTALHHSFMLKQNYPLLTKFLISAGASTSQKNKEGETALSLVKDIDLKSYLQTQNSKIKNQIKAHKRFFDYGRIKDAKKITAPNKAAISALKDKFVNIRRTQANRLSIHGISSRRLITTDSGALSEMIQGYEPPFDTIRQPEFVAKLTINKWKLGKNFNDANEEKLNLNGTEINSAILPAQGQVGNFFMKQMGEYGYSNQPNLFRGLPILTIIYKLTSQDKKPANSEPEKEKLLAQALLDALKSKGKAIDLSQFYHSNNEAKDAINRLLVLTGIKEITRRMQGSRVTLPLSIAYIQGLKLVAAGHLTMKDIFDKDAKYGLPTPEKLADNVSAAEIKLMSLNVLYDLKFPETPLSTCEEYHQLLLDGYGGGSDSDGDEYSDDDIDEITAKMANM